MAETGCYAKPAGSPCGSSPICGNGICDEFSHCVDGALCAAGKSDVERVTIALFAASAFVLVVCIAIAIWLGIWRRGRVASHDK
jgi:hypothetical protein